MGQRRILGGGEMDHYHVVSRVVDRRFVFGEEEKVFFRRQLRKLEGFTGVRCLTYCVMSNHFHLLVEVSVDERRRFEAEGSDEAFLERLGHLYGGGWVQEVREQLASMRRAGDVEGVDALKRPYLLRMHDLSVFMRELKQRFSRWFNGRRGRKGTLWEGRYRSVLVDGARGHSSDDAAHTVLEMVAAYIDLNPVRAGIVRCPAEYRFSGFGEACEGNRLARQRLTLIYRPAGGEGGTAAFATYQALLGEVTGLRGTGASDRAGGRSELAALLRRIRHLTRGAAIGSRAFVEGVFLERRALFGPRRRSGARRPRGPAWSGLYALRDLGEAA